MAGQKRGRKATGKTPTHAFNFHLTIENYEWIMRTKPEGLTMTKYINNIIRERYDTDA